MIKSPLIYTVPKHDFERVTGSTSRTVQRIGTTYSWGRERATETIAVRNAGFEIEINVDKIIDDIVRRAKGSKALKSRILGGLIKCKAVNVKKISERVVEIPLREGYEEVKVEIPL